MSWKEGHGEGWRGGEASGLPGTLAVVWKIFSSSLSNMMSNGCWAASSLTSAPLSFELEELSSLRSTNTPLIGPESLTPAFAFPFPLSLGRVSAWSWRISLHNFSADSCFGSEGGVQRSKTTGVSGCNSSTRAKSSSEEPTYKSRAVR